MKKIFLIKKKQVSRNVCKLATALLNDSTLYNSHLCIETSPLILSAASLLLASNLMGEQLLLGWTSVLACDLDSDTVEKTACEILATCALAQEFAKL